MWFAQIINSLQTDQLSEDLLSDITQTLQETNCNDFQTGYNLIMNEMIDLGYQFIQDKQYPSAQLVIYYLQLWNKEICPFVNDWTIRNLELTYTLQTKQKPNLNSIKNQILALIDEQAFYSIGGTAFDLYETAYSLYLYCMIDTKSKQQAVQAILKLQQLIIKNLDTKLNRKVHVLMAKIYERMGQIEQGKFDQNLYYQQAYNSAAQVLDQDDPQLKQYQNLILKQEAIVQKPMIPQPLNQKGNQNEFTNIELERRDIIINEQMGQLQVSFNKKQKQLILELYDIDSDSLTPLFHTFNLSDIENEILIYSLQPLPVFLQEFVNIISSNIDIEQDQMRISIEYLNLESYEKTIKICEKNINESFVFFSDQLISKDNSEFQPILGQEDDDDNSIHPLLSDKII